MNRSPMLLTVALTSITCAALTGPGPDLVFALGQEFTLSLGQGAFTADSAVTVRFTSVPNDSRCPSDVICVWEGFARVALAVTAEGTSESPVLSTNASVCCTEDTVRGFVFAVRGLDPLPRAGERDVPYAVRLLVTRTP